MDQLKKRVIDHLAYVNSAGIAYSLRRLILYRFSSALRIVLQLSFCNIDNNSDTFLSERCARRSVYRSLVVKNQQWNENNKWKEEESWFTSITIILIYFKHMQYIQNYFSNNTV